MNTSTFCAFPFNSVFLGADGLVKTCCSSSQSIGDINKDSIEDIIQGNLAKEIRQSIVEGKWHNACTQCKHLESLGGRTERTGVLYKFDEFKNSTSSTFRLQQIDLRWSNVCNLSCNYCYEYFSSQWAAIKNIKVNYNKSNAEENLLFFIDKNKETIQSVNLLGGEPLLQKQNLKLFDILPNKKYYLLTNLSTDIPNSPIAQKLITMPNVAWAVSFETINKKFEYVRHGANWEKLCSNLKYLKENNVREINAHPMYCIYSAFNLCEFYDFIDESNYFTNIYWCVIQNIKGINVFTLSKSLKQKAIDEISRCVEKYKSKYDMSALINIKNSLLESLAKEYKKSDIEDFFDWLYKLENTQNVNKSYVFKDLWPEIYEEMLELK